MDINKDSTKPDTSAQEEAGLSAQVLTPLELNGIKLDVTHTVLTPELLERMKTRRVL